MRLTDFLKLDHIKVYLKSSEKHGVIKELSDMLLTDKSESEKNEVLKALLEREKVSSTGIGHGIAIPHARTNVIEDLIAGIGIVETPIDFDSLDKKPVKIIFLILCPKDLPGLQIRYLARSSRLLNDESLREKLFKCTSSDEVYHTIFEYENQHFH
ncbi:MAG: PTS sugar transporter subunit IIA [Chitinispirillia bacterium]